MILRTVALTCAFLAGGAAHAEDVLDPLVTAATNAARPIELRADGTAGGPGWDLLVRDMSAAQFALIGEQHSIADVAKLSAALRQALGFDYTAMETGPFTTDMAEDLLRKPGGKETLTDLAAIRPDQFAYPFISLAEELDFAAGAVAASQEKADALWGLDQEFIGAGALMAKRLGSLAQTPAQKAAVADFAALFAKDRMALGASPETIFEPLKTAFAADKAASRIIDELILSNRIYAPFTGRGGAVYTANLARESYMKRNFASRVAAAQKRGGKLPHVLLKFGANHMSRGISPTDVPALGQFVADYAEARGVTALNVAMDCAGGFQRDYQSGKAEPCESMAPAESLFYKVAAPTGITLIHLRAIRPEVKRKSSLDPETRRLIFAYDFFIVFRDPQAATLLK